MINSRNKSKKIRKELPLIERQPVLEKRRMELKTHIQVYDKTIVKCYQAIEHTQLQSANLSLEFSFSTPGDPKPMDLYIYWACMDRAGLQDLLTTYLENLQVKRNGHYTELQNINRQLESLGLPAEPTE
jgi:hypothetical protein